MEYNTAVEKTELEEKTALPSRTDREPNKGVLSKESQGYSKYDSISTKYKIYKSVFYPVKGCIHMQ